MTPGFAISTLPCLDIGAILSAAMDDQFIEIHF